MSKENASPEINENAAASSEGVGVVGGPKEPTAVELMAAQMALLQQELAELKVKKAETAKEPEKPELKPKASPQNDYMEQYVPINLFYDGEKYKDDVFLSVNGETCLVKRGVPTKIKRKFAVVLTKQHKQDAYAARIASQYAEEYEKRAPTMG